MCLVVFLSVKMDLGVYRCIALEKKMLLLIATVESIRRKSLETETIFSNDRGIPAEVGAILFVVKPHSIPV